MHANNLENSTTSTTTSGLYLASLFCAVDLAGFPKENLCRPDASPVGRNYSTLLGNGGICVLATCPELLPDSKTTDNNTHN